MGFLDEADEIAQKVDRRSDRTSYAVGAAMRELRTDWGAAMDEGVGPQTLVEDVWAVVLELSLIYKKLRTVAQQSAAGQVGEGNTETEKRGC